MANKVATRDAYGKALLILGAENSNVVVLDADLSKSTKTADIAKKYPERFFNMGIAESNLLAMLIFEGLFISPACRTTPA